MDLFEEDDDLLDINQPKSVTKETPKNPSGKEGVLGEEEEIDIDEERLALLLKRDNIKSFEQQELNNFLEKKKQSESIEIKIQSPQEGSNEVFEEDDKVISPVIKDNPDSEADSSEVKNEKESEFIIENDDVPEEIEIPQSPQSLIITPPPINQEEAPPGTSLQEPEAKGKKRLTTAITVIAVVSIFLWAMGVFFNNRENGVDNFPQVNGQLSISYEGQEPIVKLTANLLDNTIITFVVSHDSVSETYYAVIKNGSASISIPPKETKYAIQAFLDFSNKDMPQPKEVVKAYGKTGDKLFPASAKQRHLLAEVTVDLTMPKATPPNKENPRKDTPKISKEEALKGLVISENMDGTLRKYLPAGFDPNFINISDTIRIYPQIIEDKRTGQATFYVICGFHNRNWVFYDKVIFNADNKKFKFAVTHKKTQITNFFVSEWNYFNNITDAGLLEVIAELIHAKEASITFYGSGTFTHVLTAKEREILKSFLELYRTYFDTYVNSPQEAGFIYFPLFGIIVSQ